MSKMFDVIDEAKKKEVVIITTVEAFYKDPSLLYDFLLKAANDDVAVQFAPIETTDKSYKEIK